MVRKWLIYWVNLNPIKGSEQSAIRPCLVVSNNEVNEILPITTIMPVSSIKNNSKVYPTEVYINKQQSGLPKDSVAMIHQIRTISKDRLIKQCGEITDNKLIFNIKQALKEYFEI
jgi:mRNA interferase MazF